jgi:hypothetical protein
MAEIVAARRGGSGSPMRERVAPERPDARVTPDTVGATPASG